MTEVEAAAVESSVETAPVGEVTEVGGSEPAGVPSQEPVATEPVQTYSVKIGDQEQQVTLEDLQSGFMRQADYTRKTQEVAAMRQRLAQAESIANSLEADPEGTLRALAKAFNVGAGDDGGFDPNVEVDPTEQRLAAMERTFQAQEQARVRAQIDSEIDALLETHGDFDLAPVIQHAATNGLTVTQAYRDLHFDSVAAKQTKTEAITAQKREAAVVEGGAHRTGVEAAADNAPTTTVREAWLKAKKQLGLD